eukprot:3347165-Pyramimonas_sp.AAC.1
MVAAAERDGEQEIADAFAVARGFLLRAGAEPAPLLRGRFAEGRKSGIAFESAAAAVTLAQRKNSALPASLRRERP